MQIPDFTIRENQSGVARSKSVANFLDNEKSFLRRVSSIIIPSENLTVANGGRLELFYIKPKEVDADYTEIDPRIIEAPREETAKFIDYSLS